MSNSSHQKETWQFFLWPKCRIILVLWFIAFQRQTLLWDFSTQRMNTGTVRYKTLQATEWVVLTPSPIPYPLSVSRMLPSKLKCPLLPVNVYRFGVPQVDNDEETEAENRKRQNNTVLHCRNFWQSSASRENFWGSCEKLSRVLSKTFEGLVEFIWAPSLDFAPLPFNQVFLPLLLAVFKYHL